MLDMDTTVQELITFLKLKTACEEAVELVEKDWLPKYETFGECLVESIPEEWATWVVRNIGSDFIPEILSYYISLIKDPMRAFSLYLDCDFLSNEADIELKAIFQGKLPHAEKELKNNILIRKKVTDIG